MTKTTLPPCPFSTLLRQTLLGVALLPHGGNLVPALYVLEDCRGDDFLAGRDKVAALKLD